MALPRCDRHKRHVPYCDDCKAAVAQAEKEAQSEALQADVGFPSKEDEEEAASKQKVHDDALAAEDEETAAEKRITELAEQTPESEPVEEEIPDPWANGKTPAEGDDVGDWKPPSERDNPPDDIEDLLQVTPEQTAIEAAGKGCPECGGQCQGHSEEAPGHPAAEGHTIDCKGDTCSRECVCGKCPPMPTPEVETEDEEDIPISPEGFEKIRDIVEALESGAEVTVVIGDAHEELRQEGRREVVALVREYFSDSIDTGAFQLLEYLDQRCG